MFEFFKKMYARGRMTATQVWAAADGSKITETEATVICGPRRE